VRHRASGRVRHAHLVCLSAGARQDGDGTKEAGPESAAAEAKSPEEELAAEVEKADALWSRLLSHDDSLITDLFGGQLQSAIHCHKCVLVLSVCLSV
jgi:ubiquitin C-terminal hydrolase